MSKAYAESAFSKAYEHELTKKVEFKLEWNNGTGYFNDLVNADLGLAVGELAASWTGDGNRRRIIVVGTMFGNVVVFDRYTENSKFEHPVWSTNAPSILKRVGMIPQGALSGDDLHGLVGDQDYRHVAPNIGLRLLELQEALKDPENHRNPTRPRTAV